MTSIPTFQDIYDEAQAELESDPDHQFQDFGAGSWLDAFAGVMAVAGNAVMRWVVRRFLVAFISGAQGSDLDYVVVDRYDITRNLGESDADYRARVQGEIQNLARGTVPALLYYARNVTGILSATMTEDFAEGVVTISVTIDASATATDVLAALAAGVDEWRAANIPVNFVDVT